MKVTSPNQGKKRKTDHHAKERNVKFVLFTYNPDNRDCMYNSLMNITQVPFYSRRFLPAIMPEGVLYRNAGTEETNERTLANALISHGYMSGPNCSRRLPNDLEDDTHIKHYMKYFDDRFEDNIQDFTSAIKDAKFFILHFELFFLTEEPNDYHFVPVLKFGEDWIIMGGERGSKIRSVHSDDLPNMMFSREGRELIREHCNIPFECTALLQFTNHAVCLVPLHCGPKDRMDYSGMKKNEVTSVIGWPILNNTNSNMDRDHGVVIHMEGDKIETLSLPNMPRS